MGHYGLNCYFNSGGHDCALLKKKKKKREKREVGVRIFKSRFFDFFFFFLGGAHLRGNFVQCKRSLCIFETGLLCT